MTNAYFYSNIATPTTLSGNINNSVTSCTVADTTGWPNSFPFVISIDFGTANMELVLVTNNVSGTLTMTRAFGGTTAVAHSSGAAVQHVYNAIDATDFRTHEQAVTGIHGVSGALVGTTDIQTLTNKTLTTPTLTNPTVNAAAFTGNLTGTPTWTGAVNFSGIPNFTNGASVAGAVNFTGALTGTSASTAKLRLQNASDVSLVSTDHAFQIGGDSGGNLRMDNNEIMSANNGLINTLSIQNDGGNTSFNGALAADSVTNSITANGTVQGNIIAATRATTAGTTFRQRIGAEAVDRWSMLGDGLMSWGDGTAARDTNLFRDSANTLRTNDSLVVDGTMTASTGQLTTLNVSGTANLPITSASGATVGAIGAGWSSVGINGAKIGGITFITGVVNRTGATITPETGPNTGNITDSTLFTLTAAWRPNASYNVPIACPLTDGISHGAGRLNTDGTLDFVTWMPGILIAAGDGNNYRFSISFPSA